MSSVCSDCVCKNQCVTTRSEVQWPIGNSRECIRKMCRPNWRVRFCSCSH